ncbi:BTAD domain-containing putative transcriptional regulator [Streptomyces spectabilis]|uniref:AfsR/SARP family transcriptional regulator n=2 Tax=Streptomyces spectabilis TaxID=68270 RepID=UPI003406A292
MGHRFRFKILGPLSVMSGSGQVHVGGPRHRTILASLLLNTDRIVSVDALVDTVWDGRPPATARTQVSICIAALRKAFKAAGFTDQVIVTAHPGYLLRIGEHEVDATEFHQLVAAAEEAVRTDRLTDAAHAYTTALGLWEGPALTGVTGRAVEDEARRLDELKLSVYEDATEVQLRLGRHHRVISELAATVRAHPLRERALHLLITAQYRSGHRAEAMESYRQGRKRFIDELGLEPGPELKELHRFILQDDRERGTAAGDGAGIDPPAAAPPPHDPPFELPTDAPGFTGRARELEQLDVLLDRGTDVRGPTAGLISGLAGVGKTCLAVRWGRGAAERFPDGVLFADLHGYDERHEPTAAAEVLGGFLRSLGFAGVQIPQAPEERESMYRSALADRRVLVVLDNARTYAQIEPLLPSSEGCSVLVTSRDQLAEFVAWPPRARVHLNRLAPAEAVELVDRVVGSQRVAAEPAAVARLVELCDLLPLALRIAAARLAAKPHWTVTHLVSRLSDEERRLDELSQGSSRIRASFGISYRCLSADAARLYRGLGLLDVHDFAPWVAAALLDTDQFTAERLIEQLVDAQFLTALGPDAAGQPRYHSPSLLRIFARERAHGEDAQEQGRAAVVRVLQAALGLAEQAHQRLYGGDFSIIHSAAPRCTPPDDLVADLLALPLEWLEAERLSLVRLVGQAAGAGLDELAWDLTLCTVVLFETRNYVDDWRQCAQRALTATREAGNVRGQGAMLYALGALEMRLRRFAGADAGFTAALALHELAGEEHGRALVLRSMAMIDQMRGATDSAMDRSVAALEVFRAVGDLSSQAHVLNNMAQIELDRGHLAQARKLSLRSVRISSGISPGGARSTAQGTHRLARVYLAEGRYDLAESALLRMIRITRASADLLGLAHGLLGLGEARLGRGDWEQARATLLHALDIVATVHSPLVLGKIKLALGEACGRGGQDERAREYLRAARDCFQRVGVDDWVKRADEALAALRTARPPGRDAGQARENEAGRRLTVPQPRGSRDRAATERAMRNPAAAARARAGHAPAEHGDHEEDGAEPGPDRGGPRRGRPGQQAADRELPRPTALGLAPGVLGSGPGGGPPHEGPREHRDG